MTYRKIEKLPILKVAEIPTSAPRMQMVEISKLVIDTDFQREIDGGGLRNIRDICKDFSWQRFTPLLCAPLEDGRLSVIDGQHRAHAAYAVGVDRVPAMIVPMSKQEQAAAFAYVNGKVTAVSTYHLLKAALVARHEWALTAKKAVEDAGCRLMTYAPSGSTKKPKNVFAVSLVRRAAENGRETLITSILKALASLDQYDDAYFFSHKILDAIYAALLPTDPEPDHAMVADFLEWVDIDGLEVSVSRLREQPAFARQSFKALFGASLTARWREFQDNPTGEINNE